MMSAALSGHRALLSRRQPPAFTSVPSWLQSCSASKTSKGAIQVNLIAISSSSCRYSSHSSHSSKSHTRLSSSAQPASSVIPSTSSTATTSLAHDVNPPPSTRPADLNQPDPISPSASASDKLKRYVALGRAYVSFYKTGLKNVYHNYRASLPIRRSLGLPSYLPTSPPPAPRSSQNNAFRKAIESLNLSRSNFQLVRRAAYDVRRMVPFTLILIVCGELTPLAVLAFGTAVTPFTCRVPRQVEKDRIQKAARKRAALMSHPAKTLGSLTPFAVGSEQELDLLAKDYVNPEWIETAAAEDILRACAVLNLAKTHARPTLLTSVMYRPRLRRYAEYLSLDDQLIRSCGGVKAMEADEVRIAVDERGGVELAEGKEGWEAERDERRWLERWLERR